MRRILNTAVILLMAGAGARADDQPAYDVSRLDPGLRVDAPAVVREELTSFEVLRPDKAREKRVIAYTIFRKEGREFGTVELPYDRFRKVADLDGCLFDEHGKEIRSLSSDDVKDESDISAYSLYSDARVRSAEMYYDRYPYTVMFTYRIDYSGILNYPTWYAQGSKEPVVHTRFDVFLPDSQQLRYWASQDSLKPRVTMEDGRHHYVWEASGLKELTEEEEDEDIEQRTSVVRIAPTAFELDDHEGSLQSWKTFGAWCANLYRDKGELPPATLHDVDSLVAGVPQPLEKARRLYRYMQGKTRYVNVSLGIGGFEPFDASYVDQHGYGDCKALSNYMVALLAHAGIRALPALVYAGGARSLTIECFPENEFNHVIVCIPGTRDSVWLECTTQTGPFGFLGDFTENRPALLMTPEGGVLVHTPASRSAQNVSSVRGRIALAADGNARADFSFSKSGNFADEVGNVMTYEHPREREEWIQRLVDVSGTTLLSYNVNGVEEHRNLMQISMNLDMPRFAASSGSRLFIVPDLNHRNSRPPRPCEERKSPVRYSMAFVSTDSTTFALPAGYRCEALPREVKLDASFGSYRSATSARGDTLLVHTRYFEIRTPVIPAEQYGEYVDFLREVTKADKAQAVAVRKD